MCQGCRSSLCLIGGGIPQPPFDLAIARFERRSYRDKSGELKTPVHEQLGCSQGRRKWGGRGGLSHPTFLDNLNYELVHSVESAIEDKRVGKAADHDEC